MAHNVLSAFEVLLFMASLYGWGSLTGRWFNERPPAGWAFPAALGIAVLIFVGGVLNAAKIAKPMVLLPLLLAGLGLAIFFIFCSCRDFLKDRPETGQLKGKFSGTTAGSLFYLALILLVFFFLITVLMPARTFNFQDDFKIYLMWPLRMLQTGTLGGNPFDHIGVSSLGGQSFMQGMFLAYGKISDVNAFDAIVCLILVLGLLKELGEELGASPVFAITAGLLAVFINPHYVNITSLYSGALMLLGLTYATILLSRSYDSLGSAGLIRAAVPCALFYAALLTLKTTFVFVAPFFWSISLLASLLLVKERKQVLLAYLSCAVITTLLLAPWISLYWHRYMREIYYILHDICYTKGTTTSREITGDVWTTLLSNKQLFYGNTYRDYLGIVGMMFFASLTTGWIAWKNRHRRESFLLVPFLAVFLSTIISYGLQFNFGPARLVVRYSCPMLIGAAPAAVLIAGWLWAQGRSRPQADFSLKKAAIFIGIILFISQLGLIWVFRGTFMDRVKRAYLHRTLISFPAAQDPRYVQYNDYALSEQGRKRMSRIQETVPAGETIFAWASMPFLFDFTRNHIYTINGSGLAYNLLVMPLAGGAERMREYFRQLGIRYIIWSYNGLGVRNPAEMGSLQNRFLGILKGLIPNSKVLFNDGAIIVYDIGGGK